MTTKPKTIKTPRKQSKALPAGLGARETKPKLEHQDVQLIPVTEGEIGGVKCLVVDARSLHQSLGVKRDFTNWIKNRIAGYGFLVGEDYENVISPNLANQNLQINGGDRKSRQYSLSLNMGKELAMVEKNDMGRAVRRYFIQCEKDLMASAAPSSKALPAPKEHESEFRDRDGKPYEKNATNRHNLKLLTLFSIGPRKAAYLEYARSVAITGIVKEEIAVNMAECVYEKTLSVNFRKFLEHPELRCDLHALKKMLESKSAIYKKFAHINT